MFFFTRKKQSSKEVDRYSQLVTSEDGKTNISLNKKSIPVPQEVSYCILKTYLSYTNAMKRNIIFSKLKPVICFLNKNKHTSIEASSQTSYSWYIPHLINLFTL